MPGGLIGAVAGFVPAWVCAALAWWVPGGWRLPVLLLLQALAVAAAARAMRALPRGRLPGLLARGGLHLLLQVALLAWLYLLSAWPLQSLQHDPSLAATLVLSLAFGLVLASLWLLWPWCACVLAEPGGAEVPDSGGLASLRMRVQHVLRVANTRPDRFMLPVALCQLASSYVVLALAGLVPGRWLIHTPGVMAACLFVLLPLLALAIVWRCLRAERLVQTSPVQPSVDNDQGMPPVARSLSLGADEIRPVQRERALLEAVRRGDSERALALLAADADPATRPEPGDPDQRSVMMLATLLPDTRLLRALIARGASVQGDGRGLTPLLIAVRDGRQNRASAVMTLLANGADVSVVDRDGNQALHFAALGNDAEVGAMLLDAGADIDALNRAGHSALGLACQAGGSEMVAWLLEHKAKPDVAGGLPALIAATDGTEDRPELVRQLLAHGARVDATDILQRTALIHAALSGHAQASTALLEAGADIEHADQRGTTALMEAARAGANEVLEALAASHPDPAARDQHGRDALMLACQSPRADADTVRILLRLGAEPRRPGKDGRSPLDHAAAAGRWNLVALLDPHTPLPASHCADVSPEPGADSPEHLLDALRFGHWAAVSGFQNLLRQWPQSTLADLYLQLLQDDAAVARRWLFDHGMRADARTSDGRPLIVAVLDFLPEAVEALDELLQRGQRLAGRGLLAHAMGWLGSAAEGAALVPRLIEHDADLFGTDAQGLAPLHQAARHGMVHALQLLLAKGCNPNVRDAGGQTPLHHVLKSDNPQALRLVRSLVAFGADPEATDAAGETALGQALENDDESCAGWLRWGTWRLPGRPLRASDLPPAAALGDEGAVRRLLELGFDVDTRDAQGATALLRACGNGHPRTALALLDAGADVGLSTPGGATPLTAAVTAREAALVSLLLERGAALDQKLSGGATALLVSAALGHADIAACLLDAGADVTAADGNGRTALHAAAQFSFGSDDSLSARRLLDVLLAHGADSSRTDHNGASALLFMLGAHARPGSPCNATHLGALLPVLLEAGAPPNVADARGVSPLHACAMHALSGPARLLLARGADRNARDNHNRTPADVARILGFVDVAHELRPG